MQGTNQNKEGEEMNKRMDLGRYLVGRNENMNVGMRLIYNPETCGKNYLLMLSISLLDGNARRMAGRLAIEA